MANHIVHAFKRFALSTAIRFMPAGKVALSQPEPLRRFAGEASLVEDLDAWLFDGDAAPVSAAAQMLSGELNRVSSALSELRSILADLSRFSPIETVAVNAVDAPNFRWSEDVLFDGDILPVQDRPVLSLDGEAAFLFEDEQPVPANGPCFAPH